VLVGLKFACFHCKEKIQTRIFTLPDIDYSGCCRYDLFFQPDLNRDWLVLAVHLLCTCCALTVLKLHRNCTASVQPMHNKTEEGTSLLILLTRVRSKQWIT